ncbi:MAG: class I SAM-dependent methyltransferase [Acidimicrobiales bacterium]
MALRSDERPTRSGLVSVETSGGLRPSTNRTVARAMSPLLGRLFGGSPPLRLVFWDGSAAGPLGGPGTLVLRAPRALARLVWSPDELGMARAFVTGDIDLDGDLFEMLMVLEAKMKGRRRLGPGAVAIGLWTALRLGAIGLPPSRPEEEVHLGGWLHSKRRDAEAIRHHYDVGNDFYRLVLGPSMTYSCARFDRQGMSLEEAQGSKHDLICRKLGLAERPGARLLDVGCGRGSMAMHAAKTYGARVVAVTLSRSQVELARERVRGAGLEANVEVRRQDYRDLRGETFDAISSIGMFEHVGTKRMDEYFSILSSLLAPTGRLLNHAISTPGGSRMHGRSFMNRYVFPDGELLDLANVVGAMERAGFEVRDVESLREHYSETLHAWVANLESSWDEVVALVGGPRARVWRLYMAGSANGFDDGGIAVHQVLGVVPALGGASGMPRARSGWG